MLTDAGQSPNRLTNTSKYILMATAAAGIKFVGLAQSTSLADVVQKEFKGCQVYKGFVKVT